MNRWIWIVAGVAAVVAGVAFVMLDSAGPGEGAQSAAAPGDAVAGAALYAENCAACHGANLEGQADWRSPNENGVYPAPPHDETGHTWHHSDAVLFDYTKLGGQEMMQRQGVEFESGMPAFGELLSDQEIQDILAYIKSTWSERIQQMQSERS